MPDDPGLEPLWKSKYLDACRENARLREALEQIAKQVDDHGRGCTLPTAGAKVARLALNTRATVEQAIADSKNRKR